MARPKSEDKRNAILAAATEVFAGRGLSAPTSAISSAAGIAEGTLFTYFKTKEELVNALYQEIKLELADAMMSGFPSNKKSVRERLRHVWDHYIAWGVANPLQQKVLSQLKFSGALSEEAKTAGSAPFLEIQKMAEDAAAQRILQSFPQEFIAAAIGALAEITMEFIRQHPDDGEKYQRSGFDLLWRGIEYRR
jgi:AcrR family transcriptional regulator